MRILVTGGGGFLGSHIARRLHARGDEVCVLGRSAYPRLEKGIEAVRVDLRDRDAAIEACKDRDVVFHAAAVPGIWGDRDEFFSINVDATRNVVDGCCVRGVKKLIYTSSPSVVYNHGDMENVDESVPYPRSYSCDYALTKAIAERMVLDANGAGALLTVSLRPHLIWGPGDPHLVPRIIQRAREGKLVRVGEGRNKVDLIYIDNAVEAHVRACDALKAGAPPAGRRYFVSDGEPVVLWDWINHLLTELKIQPVKRSISYRAAWALGGVLEVAHKVFGLSGEPRMTRFLAAQLATSHYFDISRARKDFGYQPAVAPSEGLRRLVRSLCAQSSDPR
ncbi:MAG: NAD-dependent epimerase/dehydratase family protein [Nitrospinales bacterium]